MTAHKSPQAKSWYQERESDAGNVQGVIGYLPDDHGLTLAVTDTIQMVKVPKGAVVMDLMYETGNLGANVYVTVGDGSDTDRYISNTRHNGSGTLTRKNQTDLVGVPCTYSDQDTIDLSFTNQAPANNVAMRLDAFYICGVDVTP